MKVTRQHLIVIAIYNNVKKHYNARFKLIKIFEFRSNSFSIYNLGYVWLRLLSPHITPKFRSQLRLTKATKGSFL